MEYTIDDLLSFIERHDEHEGYYREQLIRKVKAEALEEAAEEFASRLPDGTGNGRAYNSWRVAEILRARAAAIRGEQP